MSDNYHQAVMGGTGANHIMMGTGDAIWFSDGNGNALEPPENVLVAGGSPNGGIVNEIENPNAQAGTNNWYTRMVTAAVRMGRAPLAAERYTDCSD